MKYMKEFNCAETAYVDKSQPYTVFSKNSTLTSGLTNSNALGLNIYKIILKFNLCDLNPDMIKNAYLYLFVEDIKATDSSLKKIGICGNYNYIKTDSLTWDSFPKECFTEILHLTIPKNSNNSYIKINITKIIKDLSQFDVNYNIVLGPILSNSNIVIKFASKFSKNPPYLKLEFNSMDNNSDYEKNNNTETDTFEKARNTNNPIYPDSDNIINVPTLLAEILTLLQSQSQTINNLQESEYKDHYRSDFSNISDRLDNFSLDINTLHNEISSKSYEENMKFINNSIVQLSQKLDFLASENSSIKESFENNDFTENIKEVENLITNLNSDFNTNETILNDLKGKITEIITSITTKTDEMSNSMQKTISEINPNTHISELKYSLDNILKILNDNTIKAESVNNSNEIFYKSISSYFEKLNEKLSNLEALNSKLDSFENNSITLSQNFLDLNQEIAKLKDMVLPVSKQLELLKSDFSNLKENMEKINDLKNSSESNSSEINMINDRINILGENVDKIINILSSITIESIN